jgi:hypothetical protein
MEKLENFHTIRVSIDGRKCDSILPILKGKSFAESDQILRQAFLKEIEKRVVEIKANEIHLFDGDLRLLGEFNAWLAPESLSAIRTKITSEFYDKIYLERLLDLAQAAVDNLSYLTRIWQESQPAAPLEPIEE